MKQEHKGTTRVYKGKSVYDETLVRMRLLLDLVVVKIQLYV